MVPLKVAIMYDFDKTLSPKDMQEFGYIASIGYENSKDFWREVSENSIRNQMEPMASYMYWMMKKSKYLTKEHLQECGESIDLFPGVETWFSRINAYALEKDIEVEHYIISCGLQEMIEGTSIAKEFKEIYGCRFHYDEQGFADWPARIVNYTTKTQYLFRINKGVLDESNDVDLNKATSDDEKYISFNHMIYVGDGFTDVPCMKVVSQFDGYSIAIYQNEKSKIKYAEPLLKDKRANFIAFADYQENSKMDKIVKGIIDKIQSDVQLSKLKGE